MDQFIFDVLPVHDQPKPSETLTGWLRRLGVGNNLGSIDGLTALCFPSQSRRVTRDQADFPPIVIEQLAVATHCDIETLHSLTFFHLGRKFGRATHPQPLSRFLGGSLAPHLRYCPICLSVDGYYKLLWRFQFLEGCAEHQCYLFERCPQCELSMPLLTTPFTLERCPHCLGSLLSRSPELDLSRYQ